MGETILFLSWGNPWPPHSGAAIRRWGLLRALGMAYPLELLVLSRKPLAIEEAEKLEALSGSVTRIPLRDVKAADKALALERMIAHGLPYHGAVLLSSLRGHPDVRRRIEEYPGIVFAGAGHWGTLIRDRRAPNWILNQNDADVDFWRVYAAQAGNPLVRAAAGANRLLSSSLYGKVYRNAGRILSVCEEDKRLTLELAPEARVDVLETGVDCDYYRPAKTIPEDYPPRVLFTGTSAARNVLALRWFTSRAWPLVRERVPGAELVVGGDFSPAARRAFQKVGHIRFTGRIGDLRPCFNQSHVYISPFDESYGAKVKIAEALAMGMAIVSKPGGIRGYPLVDGESALLAWTPEEFAAGCVRLLSDASLRRRLEASARRIAERTLDWKVLGERLRSIVDDHRASLGDAAKLEPKGRPRRP